MNWDGFMWLESIEEVNELPKFPDTGSAIMINAHEVALVFTGKEWMPIMADSSHHIKAVTFTTDFIKELDKENELYKTEMFKLLYA